MGMRADRSPTARIVSIEFGTLGRIICGWPLCAQRRFRGSAGHVEVRRTHMKLTELFLGELDREAAITRRALERVPEGRDEWKPHDKSMPLGRLAGLVAMMPSWITMMIDKE